jgi:hypothetical protein
MRNPEPIRTPGAGLPGRWRAEALTLRSWGAEDKAKVLERVAAELEAELRAGANAELTLEEAAQECGYHPDSLGRLIREGKLANVGRKHAPCVRRGDLPQKPRALQPEPQLGMIGRCKASIARAIATSDQE